MVDQATIYVVVVLIIMISYDGTVGLRLTTRRTASKTSGTKLHALICGTVHVTVRLQFGRLQALVIFRLRGTRLDSVPWTFWGRASQQTMFSSGRHRNPYSHVTLLLYLRLSPIHHKAR